VVSVCLSLTVVIPAKNDRSDRDAVWVAESGGSKKPRVRLGCRCPTGNGTFRGSVWPIAKHRISGIGQKGKLCKMVRPILTTYTSYDVLLHKEVPFGGRDVTAPNLWGKVTHKPPSGV